MNWVIDNKQWIFSGIGIAITVGIFKLFFRKKGNTQSIVGNEVGKIKQSDKNGKVEKQSILVKKAKDIEQVRDVHDK